MSEKGAARRRHEAAAEGPGIAELIHRLNVGWRLEGPPGPDATLKQRLMKPLRRAVTRVFGQQETFNSTLVQYLNATYHLQLDEVEAMMDEVRRYRESLVARERRMESAMDAMRAEHAELRTALNVAVTQLRTHRGREHSGGPTAGALPFATVVPSPGTAPATPPDRSTLAATGVVPATQTSSTTPSGHALSDKYVGFEDQFRGTAEQIRERLASYLPIFEGASDVLDIGCGRGEFLRLLAEHGISARGIDLNEAMVEVCRQHGLRADAADALGWLRAQPDESVGDIFAAQVVEHLEPGYLTQFLDVARDKLRPGAAIVLETINPACWFAFFESYVRDITHVRPLHPDTLRFLLIASGFHGLRIEYRAPYPEHEKLQPVAGAALPADAAETLNANVDKLNSLLFTYLDYAAIGRK